MSLQEKLDAFKDAFQKLQPPEVVETMRRATAGLIASGQAGRALKGGDVAPAFALPNQDGRLVDLQELLAKGALDCPRSRLQAARWPPSLHKRPSTAARRGVTAT